MLDDYQSKKALVIGGAGFIGSEIVRQLYDYGAEVSVLDNFSTGTRENILHNDIEIYTGDIRYMELVKSAMEGKDIIFHLAACPFIPSCYNYPSEFIDVNIRGTLNVLLSAKELRPEKIVKISTGEVYGVPVYLPIDDKHPTNPISTYAGSKLSAERL